MQNQPTDTKRSIGRSASSSAQPEDDASLWQSSTARRGSVHASSTGKGAACWTGPRCRVPPLAKGRRPRAGTKPPAPTQPRHRASRRRDAQRPFLRPRPGA
ncbi:hypothetical protein CDD83_1033 [Cordyceps sp. RAO-2017]|nr:hypothetical protein CDD83_1033 [Cordyceps sp. RAO-2017]